MLRLQGLRKLSVSCVAPVSWNGLYHPKVCWATNEMVGRHPKFNKFPDPRIPSAALLSEFSRTSWRRMGARKPTLWKNARRRKYNIDYDTMPQRYDELCEYSITLVEHEELMPKNYVRFHIPRQMTKYELFNYLDKLYGIKMAHIDIEARLPIQFDHFNLDHPENRDMAVYPDKFHAHDGNSPHYYPEKEEGLGWTDYGHSEARVHRETEGFCIAHCYLPRGESFNFPDLFGENESNEDELRTRLHSDISGTLGDRMRRELKHDEDGSIEQLAQKAFGSLNGIAGISTTPYTIISSELVSSTIMVRGTREDREKILSSDNSAENVKKLETFKEEEELTQYIDNYMEEFTELKMVNQGYHQKGQDTYRNVISDSPVRIVPVSYIMVEKSGGEMKTSPVPEKMLKNAPKEVAISHAKFAHLVQNAVVWKKTIIPA